MKKLIFYYSAMNGGKSTALIQVAYNYEANNQKIVLVKSKKDTKAGNYLSARNGQKRQVDIILDSNDTLLSAANMKLISKSNCILVDEAQLLEEKQIEELYQELDIINTLDDENYQFELKKLCPKALQFFDNLELDSDEIDILLGVQEEFNKENQKDDQMFDHAKKYYDDMMNKYKHGDSSMFDQLQNMMRNLGINPDDLKGKSPEELNQYIDDLCDRFHISRSQLDSLINKFNH